MAMKTKTKLCLVAAATAVAGAAVGAYFGAQPATDSAALAPMLGGFAVGAFGALTALVTAPWGALKGIGEGWKFAEGDSEESSFERNRRLFGDELGTPAGIPSPGNVGHPLWETYYGPAPGRAKDDR